MRLDTFDACKLSSAELARFQLILTNAFKDPIHDQNISAITNIASTNSLLYRQYFHAVYDVNNELVGGAFSSPRLLNIGGIHFHSLSVGPVAIFSELQGCGYGKNLIRYIHTYALANGFSMVYLQGIDHFYTKLGYVPMMLKSKIHYTLQAPCITSRELSIREMLNSDIDSVSTIFAKHSLSTTFSSNRNHVIWRWLLESASTSWYFFKPKVVCLNNHIIGYFVSDPCDPMRIREALVESCELVAPFLSAFSIEYEFNIGKEISIMCPSNSFIRTESAKLFRSFYSEMRSPVGGQLLHFLSRNSLIKILDRLVSHLLVRDTQFSVTHEDLFRYFQSLEACDFRSLSSLGSYFLTGIEPIDSKGQAFSVNDCIRAQLFALFRRSLPPPFVFQGDNY